MARDMDNVLNTLWSTATYAL